MDLVDLINRSRFLGNEFLLWLWYKSECFEAQFHMPDFDHVEIWIDDALTLEATLAETERNTIAGGSPAYSPEAKTALRHGKRPTKAKIGLVNEGREWAFTLKAEDLSVSGVKIPALLSREEDEQFYERMALLDELERIIEALYKEFLTIRLDVGTWDKVMLPAMREWVQRDDVCRPEDYPSEQVEQRLGITSHPRLNMGA